MKKGILTKLPALFLAASLLVSVGLTPNAEDGINYDNLALEVNGGKVSVSSEHSGGTFPASKLNDGTADGYWNDGTQNEYPDWCEISWDEAITANRVILRLPVMTYLQPEGQRLVGTFTLQYKDEDGGYKDIETVENWMSPISDDGTQIKKFAFAEITTTAFRVTFSTGNSDGWNFLEEIEVYNSVNIALASNGAVAAASSVHGSKVFPQGAVNDGRTTKYWNDGTQNEYPDWCEIQWGSVKYIDSVVLRLPVMPPYLTEQQRTIGSLTLQYKDSNGVYRDIERVTNWTAPIKDDGSQIKSFTFPMVETRAVRVKFDSGTSEGWSFMEEIMVYSFGSAPEIPREVKVGYLLHADFSVLLSYGAPIDQKPLSGWETDRSGGDWFEKSFEALRICDTSTSEAVTMQKRIVNQLSGKIVMDLKFTQLELMDGVTWQLRSGSTPAVKIVTSGGNICYETADGETVPLKEYKAGTEYGIRVIADIYSNKADIYVDGELLAEQADFCNSLSNIDYVFFKTGDKSTGEIQLPTIRVYKGYTVKENFMTVKPGTTPSDWQLDSAGGTAGTAEVYSGVKPDTRNYIMTDTSSEGAVKASREFEKMSGVADFSYWFLLPEKKDGMTVKLSGGDNTVAQIVTDSGNICYILPNGEKTVLWNNYKPNIWYKVRVKADLDTGTADLYINESRKASGVALTGMADFIDKMSFETPGAETGEMWFDDITLNEFQPLPEDYVPVPQPIELEDDYIIGVQSCPLWSEGKHLGYVWVKDSPARKSYLGWYDQELPETSDWQIKWMLENGINLNYFCWYPGIAGQRGNAIKETPYFGGISSWRNAEYSDMIDYAVTITNHAPFEIKDMDDWKENVVPYLIEQFFKDERYLKVDNKPFVGIHEVANMPGSTPAETKEAIEYLREACIAEGFDGVIVALQDNDSLEYGADYTYTYYGRGRDYDETKLDMITAPTCIWDPSTWYQLGTTTCNMGSAEQLKGSMIDYKNHTMKTYSSDSLASRMLLIDNWNEFGEGHFIIPSGFNGFDYLEAVRDVFGKGEFPVNIAPTPEQRARWDALYPKDW